MWSLSCLSPCLGCFFAGHIHEVKLCSKIFYDDDDPSCRQCRLSHDSVSSGHSVFKLPDFVEDVSQVSLVDNLGMISLYVTGCEGILFVYGNSSYCSWGSDGCQFWIGPDLLQASCNRQRLPATVLWPLVSSASRRGMPSWLRSERARESIVRNSILVSDTVKNRAPSTNVDFPCLPLSGRDSSHGFAELLLKVACLRIS